MVTFCTVAGFTNIAAAAPASSSVSVSTYSSTLVLLDSQSSVPFPAIGAGALTMGSIALSSAAAGALNVAATVSFVVATAGTPVKTVTVAGATFAASASLSAVCTNLGATGPVSATYASPNLVIAFATAAAVSTSALPVTCTVTGLVNVATETSSSFAVDVSTFDLSGLFVDRISNVYFPAVFVSRLFISAVVPSCIITSFSSIVTVSGSFQSSAGSRCSVFFGSQPSVMNSVTCIFISSSQALVRIPAFAFTSPMVSSAVALTDLAGITHSSTSSVLTQLAVVSDFVVNSVNASLNDAFIDVAGGPFGSSVAALSATVLFSRMQVLGTSVTNLFTLSGTGSEFEVGDIVRFTGNLAAAPNLASGAFYVVASKPSPTTITLNTLDGVLVITSKVLDIANLIMTVASHCSVASWSFTPLAFSCARAPLSAQAQLAGGLTVELSVLGVMKTFPFPLYSPAPATSRLPAAPAISLVSAAQRISSSQTITLLGSNFGANVSAIAVATLMPSRCDRQFTANADQERPAPTGSPSGSATVTFTQSSPTSVVVTVVATGLSSALTGVHIHLQSSVTDTVVFALCGEPPLIGCITTGSP